MFIPVIRCLNPNSVSIPSAPSQESAVGAKKLSISDTLDSERNVGLRPPRSSSVRSYQPGSATNLESFRSAEVFLPKPQVHESSARQAYVKIEGKGTSGQKTADNLVAAISSIGNDETRLIWHSEREEFEIIGSEKLSSDFIQSKISQYNYEIWYPVLKKEIGTNATISLSPSQESAVGAKKLRISDTLDSEINVGLRPPRSSSVRSYQPGSATNLESFRSAEAFLPKPQVHESSARQAYVKIEGKGTSGQKTADNLVAAISSIGNDDGLMDFNSSISNRSSGLSQALLRYGVDGILRAYKPQIEPTEEAHFKAQEELVFQTVFEAEALVKDYQDHQIICIGRSPVGIVAALESRHPLRPMMVPISGLRQPPRSKDQYDTLYKHFQDHLNVPLDSRKILVLDYCTSGTSLEVATEVIDQVLKNAIHRSQELEIAGLGLLSNLTPMPKTDSANISFKYITLHDGQNPTLEVALMESAWDGFAPYSSAYILKGEKADQNHGTDGYEQIKELLEARG